VTGAAGCHPKGIILEPARISLDFRGTVGGQISHCLVEGFSSREGAMNKPQLSVKAKLSVPP
jgi:hypothetical protein